MKLKWGFFLLVCLSLTWETSGHAQTPAFTLKRQFTAEFTTAMQDGTQVSSQVMVDEDKVRYQVNVRGIEKVIILRPELNKTYQVMTSQKMVIESAYQPDAIKRNEVVAALVDKAGVWQLLGTESREGLDYNKYQKTFADGHLCFFWMSKQNHLPLIMESETGGTTRFTKFIMAQPDASFFIPPSYFQNVKL